MDTLVSVQLYLRPPSQNLVFLTSHTDSIFLHSRTRRLQLRAPFSRLEGIRLRELPLFL